MGSPAPQLPISGTQLPISEPGLPFSRREPAYRAASSPCRVQGSPAEDIGANLPARVFVETRNHRRQGVSAGWKRLGPGGVGDGLVFEVTAMAGVAAGRLYNPSRSQS